MTTYAIPADVSGGTNLVCEAVGVFCAPGAIIIADCKADLGSEMQTTERGSHRQGAEGWRTYILLISAANTGDPSEGFSEDDGADQTSLTDNGKATSDLIAGRDADAILPVLVRPGPMTANAKSNLNADRPIIATRCKAADTILSALERGQPALLRKGVT